MPLTLARVSPPRKTSFARRDRAGARRIRRRWPDRADRRRLGRRRGGDPPRRRAVRARRGGRSRRVLPSGRGLPVPPGRSGRRAVGRPPAPGEPGLARGGHVRPAGAGCGRTASASRPAASPASTGLDLHVQGLDAIDGSPVLDVKPFMREFEPPGADVRQPDLVHRADARVLLSRRLHGGPGQPWATGLYPARPACSLPGCLRRTSS